MLLSDSFIFVYERYVLQKCRPKIYIVDRSEGDRVGNRKLL